MPFGVPGLTGVTEPARIRLGSGSVTQRLALIGAFRFVNIGQQQPKPALVQAR